MPPPTSGQQTFQLQGDLAQLKQVTLGKLVCEVRRDLAVFYSLDGECEVLVLVWW